MSTADTGTAGTESIDDDLAEPDDPTERVLAAERAHLARSRTELRRMRERASQLRDSDVAGDWVSAEYLDSTYELRLRQLADDPTTPLFFGRLDYLPGHGPDEEDSGGQRYYVGRRHIGDTAGQPLVVDWRADVSLPFYRARAADPMGVELRRRFGFSSGELTAYEDEPLTTPPETGWHSEILEQEIERPRVGPMRDIVATIQPEQDEIVRADLSQTICVQGAPGTGKTAVGLHRAAYLLYSHRDQLQRQRILVIGPNDAFLRYIHDVLPALGEIDAQQLTVDELTAGVRIRGTDTPAVATLKGDIRMAELLRRAVWSQLREEPAEGLVVSRGARRFRVPTYEVAELIAGIRARGVRYGAGQAMLPQRLAHAVLLRMEAAGDSPDDRVQNTVARSKPVRDYANELWPSIDPAKLLFRLWTDAEFLAEHGADLLTEAEQAMLCWQRVPRSSGSARWSPADAVLLDELADVLTRTPSVGHVVVDEAQDLSAMQLRAIGRRCSTGSATVLGDLAQATTPWASRSWDDALRHLGKSGAHVEELTQGFRVPDDVIAFAARLLPRIAPDLAPPTSIRRSGGELTVRAVPVTELTSSTLSAVRAALDRPGSVGLVTAADQVADVRAALSQDGIAHALVGEEGDIDARMDVVPAPLAKGLEFDHVIVVEPAAIIAAEPDETTGLRRLYVCLTRAVTTLSVLHAAPLPEPLRCG